MVGTPKNSDARSAAAASSTASTSKRSSRTADAPAASVPCRPTPRPCMWNNGNASTRRSSGVHRHARRNASTLDVRFACVSTAPFGRPVVPDVYPMRAGASGAAASSSGTGPSGRSTSVPTTRTPGPAARTHDARSASSTTAMRGAPSTTRWASSSAPYAVFAGMTVRPARRQATCATTRSTVDAAETSTRSPGTRPAAANRPATVAVRSSSSAPLHQRPDQSRSTARPGSARQCATQRRGSVPPAPRSTSVAEVPAGRWAVQCGAAVMGADPTGGCPRRTPRRRSPRRLRR